MPGTLVTYQFMRAIDIEVNKHYVDRDIDLIALSTISDGMDIRTYQNKSCIQNILNRDNIKNEFLNMIFDKLINKEDYTQKDIAFTIVPKINCICRGSDKKLKQNMICSFIGLYNETKMEETLSEMIKAHKEQRDTVKKFIEDNLDKIDTTNDIIIYVSKDMPRTYSGLVAGNISQRFYGKPTIMSKDIGKELAIGSGRSCISIINELSACESVEWARGHEKQFGIQFKKNETDTKFLS